MINKKILLKILSLLECNEGQMVYVDKKSSSDNYYIKTLSGVENPNIVFRIEKDTFILSNIFLGNRGIGTGTKLMKLFISMAEDINCRKFKVRIVKYDNLIIRKVLNKFNMVEVINDEEYSDFILSLGEINND